MAGLADIAAFLLQAEQMTRPTFGGYKGSDIESYRSPDSPFANRSQLDMNKVMDVLLNRNNTQYRYVPPVEGGPPPKNFYNKKPNQAPPKWAQTEEWKTALQELRKEYPYLDEAELYDIMFLESSYRPSIQNKDSGAAGLFQFTQTALDDLYNYKYISKPLTEKDVAGLTPAEQLKLYRHYMKRWNFDPRTQPMALLQAKPSWLENYNDYTADSVIYPKDSLAWKVNPGWRGPENGDITLGSLLGFYGRQWQPPPPNQTWIEALQE